MGWLLKPNDQERANTLARIFLALIILFLIWQFYSIRKAHIKKSLPATNEKAK